MYWLREKPLLPGNVLTTREAPSTCFKKLRGILEDPNARWRASENKITCEHRDKFKIFIVKAVAAAVSNQASLWDQFVDKHIISLYMYLITNREWEKERKWNLSPF